MDEMNRGNLAEGQYGNAGMGNGMMPEKGKKSGDIIKIIIPAAVLVILVGLLVGVALATGVIGSKRKTIMKAVAYTFSQSNKAIGDVWEMKDYKGMFENKQMSMTADLNFGREAGIELQVDADKETVGGYLDIKYYGMSMAEADYYFDNEEMMLCIPGITDYVFYVDRRTIEEDIKGLIEEFDLDRSWEDYAKTLNEDSQNSALIEEGMLQAGEEFAAAIRNLFDGIQVSKTQNKKLTVDGSERSCKGYAVTITGEQLAGLVRKYIEIYERNEAFENYFNDLMAYGMGFDSREEFLKYNDIPEMFEELAVKIEESDPFVMEFYIYKKALAQIYFDAGDGEYLQWDIEGGNFPLENMNLEIYTGSDTYNLTRSGSYDSGKNIYEAEYKITSDAMPDYEFMRFGVEYNKKKGDFKFDLMFDYTEFVLEGDIDKIKPGSELSIGIDTFEVDGEEVMSGDIYLSNECGEIVKPEGERVNVLKLTEDEWYEILWEMSESLYSY